MLTVRPLGALMVGRLRCENGWNVGSGPTPDCEAMDGGHDHPTGLRTEETRAAQHLPQPCPRKLRPIALLTESCVIEQQIDRLLKSVELTNLGLGTRRHCTRLAGAHKQAQDADVVLPIDLENANGRAF